MKKKKLLTALQLILILVMIFSLSKIGAYYYERYKSQKEFDKTANIFQEVIKETKEESDEELKEEESKESNKELLKNDLTNVVV